MISRIDISGVHTTVTADQRKYINKKIGKLDKYLPRQARDSIKVDVFLKESKSKTLKQCTCEVIMHVPQQNSIAVKETTINMFAAIDIVEAKLKGRLRKYKDTHGVRRLHRRVLAKMRRQTP